MESVDSFSFYQESIDFFSNHIAWIVHAHICSAFGLPFNAAMNGKKSQITDNTVVDFGNISLKLRSSLTHLNDSLDLWNWLRIFFFFFCGI